jgi:hypothetical protein
MQPGRVRRFAAGVALAIPLALSAQRSSIAPADVTAACGIAYDVGSKTPGTRVQRATGSFGDEIVSAPIRGCRVIINGSSKALGKQALPTDRLSEIFESRGWEQLPEFSSDGHDGTSFAYKRERVACIVRGEWDGGSDDEPGAPLGDPYRVTVVCGSAAAVVRQR